MQNNAYTNHPLGQVPLRFILLSVVVLATGLLILFQFFESFINRDVILIVSPTERFVAVFQGARRLILDGIQYLSSRKLHDNRKKAKKKQRACYFHNDSIVL